MDRLPQRRDNRTVVTVPELSSDRRVSPSAAISATNISSHNCYQLTAMLEEVQKSTESRYT